MTGDLKEVNFKDWCPKCKNKDVDEHDPEGKCWDCLEVPYNQDSHKPVNWEKPRI